MKCWVHLSDLCVDLSPCIHGKCVRKANREYSCTCEPGYSGLDCEIGKISLKSLIKLVQILDMLSYFSFLFRQFDHFNLKSLSSFVSLKLMTFTSDDHWNIVTVFFTNFFVLDLVCGPDVCQNGGNCSRNGSSYGCACQSNFKGKNCEIGRFRFEILILD